LFEALADRKIAIKNLPAICLPYFVIGAFLLLTVLVIYGSSQKWPLPRLAANLQVSPKIKVYF
jgi:hypothetical protein